MIYYIGVDVGTTSVRAALVECSKSSVKVSHTSVHPIQIWNDSPDHFEQSTADIWSAVISTVRAVVKESSVNVKEIYGIGFDATCSLVVLDQDLRPISVTANPANLEHEQHRYLSLNMH